MAASSVKAFTIGSLATPALLTTCGALVVAGRSSGTGVTTRARATGGIVAVTAAATAAATSAVATSGTTTLKPAGVAAPSLSSVPAAFSALMVRV